VHCPCGGRSPPLEWDAGTFTFSIHAKDLALGNFSNVHGSLESS
jgi:hypothetical protein